PDLVIHHGNKPVGEYHNTLLFPGMYPTLFPFGIGGFEDPTRPVTISLQAQANYTLDLADRAFRYHHSYIFVILNIIQRRAAHLHTHFAVRQSKFNSIAQKLVSVNAKTLTELANHLEQEGRYNSLNSEQKDALNLLRHVTTIAGHIPGSEAAKLLLRNEIRNYFGYFGLPHIFLTINPSAVHSPVFQVMYGDQSVDLSSRFPLLVAASQRALRLAQDPVAAADFYNFCVRSIFEHLLGWDYDKGCSTKQGGLFGRLRAFYGTSE
ncbi:hypothetical protein OH77DRAFT_1386949, partial [Trametes cingulata]